MKYVYFFNSSTHDIGVRIFKFSGLYKSNKKIIDNDTFSELRQFIKDKIKDVCPDFNFMDEKIKVTSLSFLHEVEE